MSCFVVPSIEDRVPHMPIDQNWRVRESERADRLEVRVGELMRNVEEATEAKQRAIAHFQISVVDPLQHQVKRYEQDVIDLRKQVSKRVVRPNRHPLWM